MAEGQLEVVDEGEELLRHGGAFVGPGVLEVAGVALVRVVEVGHRAPRLVLEGLGEALELSDAVAVAVTVTGVVVALARVGRPPQRCREGEPRHAEVGTGGTARVGSAVRVRPVRRRGEQPGGQADRSRTVLSGQ